MSNEDPEEHTTSQHPDGAPVGAVLMNGSHISLDTPRDRFVQIAATFEERGKLSAPETRELINIRRTIGDVPDDHLDQLQEKLRQQGRLPIGDIRHVLLAPPDDGATPHVKSLSALHAHVDPLTTHEPSTAPRTVPTDAELLDMARALVKTDTVDPIDVLRAGLVYHMMDPIALNIRSREQARELLVQASRGVAVVTELAANLGVTYLGSPVERSFNVAVWSGESLSALGAHVSAHVDALVARGEAGIETARVAEQASAMLRQQLETLRARAQEVATQIASAQALARDQVLALNSMLGSYCDQPVYVVAQVDPVTNSPTKYALVVPDGERAGSITQAGTLARATKFGSWEDANDVRVRLIRGLRERGKAARLGVIASDAPVIAVMQMSLRTVRAEDL